jgi:guanylate kinase
MAIFALIGQSSSGKSTIERTLMNMGFPRIVSYTTRSKREKEKDGVDYHFIDADTFHKLQDQNFFAETAQYNGWNYGLSLEDIDFENKDYIVVVTIHGYDELVKVCGTENVITIHIKVDERERIIRQLVRGDSVDEVIRRIYTDRNDFAEAEEICDYIVVNKNLYLATDTVVDIIKSHRKA